MVAHSALPAGQALANLAIIDTGSRISNVATTVFMEPSLPVFPTMNNLPAFSFLIEHATQGRYLFDLGVRKDLDALPAHITAQFKELGWDINVSLDVADVLVKENIALESIKGVFWSHWHFDHTGNMEAFPASTDLIVGPGFKSKFVPSYPTVPEGPVDERAWSGRNLTELEFDDKLIIADLRAIDFFGDGSFYLLDSPGHAVGHLMGLARTTPSTFILIGADTCHHPGHFRPSAHQPIPQLSCPGEVLERVHPNPDHATTQPFYSYPCVPDGAGIAHNRDQAESTRGSLMELDADPNVLVVIAHDETVLRGTKTKFFPASAAGWKDEGWGEDVRWRFLGDFGLGVE